MGPRVLLSTVLAITFTICAAGAEPVGEIGPPPAGLISAIEGRVLLDNQPLGANIVDAPRVARGDVLGTENGRAELLLNPGAFLRLGGQSAVKLIASSPSRTRVELLRGEALLEVLQLGKQEALEIIDRQAYTRLLQNGLYVFRAEGPSVTVYDGKARVEDDRRAVSLGKGHSLILDTRAPRPQKFDLTRKDPLYDWSAARTRSLAHASESMVENLLAFARESAYDAGWYWNPWFQAWTFVPASGYRLSPFGYGFYSPATPHSVMPVFADFR